MLSRAPLAPVPAPVPQASDGSSAEPQTSPPPALSLHVAVPKVPQDRNSHREQDKKKTINPDIGPAQSIMERRMAETAQTKNEKAQQRH